MLKLSKFFPLLILLITMFSGCEPKPEPGPGGTTTPIDYTKSLQIGYCSNDVEYTGTGTQTTYGAAILLTDSILTNSGKEIVAVRVNFFAAGVSEAEIFITENLDGDPLYTQAFTPTDLGWEYVKLNTPFPIKKYADKLMIGYTVKASQFAMGYNVGTKKNSNADYFRYQNKWQHLATNSYIPRSFVSVQAFVAGGDYSDYKQRDIYISNVEYNEYLPLGGENIMRGIVTNYGVKQLSKGVKITYSDGTNTHSVNVEKTLMNGESVEFELPVASYSAEAEVNFSLTAEPIDEANEGNKNKAEGKQTFYGNHFPRTLLYEEFSGDQCGNCPAGAEAMERSVVGNESRVAMITHHVGYNEDRFTIAESSPLTWFYNDGGGTYAPAMMIDRRIIDNNTSLNRGNPCPVFHPGGTSVALTNRQLAIPAYVSVNLNVTYAPASREVTVNVSGEFIKDYPNARLNVCLVQDNIIAPQSGGGNNYNHLHVIRAFLSMPSWGDVISNSAGATYSETYTYTIPESITGTKNIAIPCVPENMYIVAFVADRISSSAANIDKSEVRNAAFKKIVE